MTDETSAEEYAFVGDITDYWTYTQVRDRLLLMPGLTDPAMRMYLIVRSMIGEKKKHLPGQGLRRMTIDQMCFLLSRDTGKPVSVSLMYQILTLLKDLDLMVPLDTKQDVGAGQMKGKEKAVCGILRGFLVRDLPPVPYTGWRNAWDKLNHYRPDWRENPPLPPTHVTTTVVDDNGRTVSTVCQMPQDVVFQDSGTGSEGCEQDSKPDEDPFQEAGKPFQDSGTPFQEAGTDSPVASEDGGPKQGSQTTLSKKNDALSARSAGDARRASQVSSVRELEGGCAASSKDQPSPEPEEPKAQAKAASSKPKHTREQLDLVRAVRAHYPPDVLNGWENPGSGVRTRPLPDVWELSQAILDALAGDAPAADRTVEQLGARIQQRWNQHGWAEKFYAGHIDSLVGAAVAMVRPLKASDRYGCGNPRCDAGKDVDTGVECHVCPQRLSDRKRSRRVDAEPSGQPSPPRRPAAAPASPRGYRECACRNPIRKDSTDDMCRSCRKRADYDRAQLASAGVPRQARPVDQGSYGPPPF